MHSCKKELFLITFSKDELDFEFAFCKFCNEVYFTSYIKLFCKECQETFITSNLENGALIKNEFQNKISNSSNNNFNNFNKNNGKNLCAYLTYQKYHSCNSYNWQPIKCLECQGNNKILFNIEENTISCKGCPNFDFKDENKNNIQSLYDECSFCKEEFQAKLKLFNGLEKRELNQTIKNAMFCKELAFPGNIFSSSCNEKIKNNKLNIFHDFKCVGIIYAGEYNFRKVIVCSICKFVSDFDKFVWICPCCRTIDCKYNVDTKYENNDTLDNLKFEENNLKEEFEQIQPRKRNNTENQKSKNTLENIRNMAIGDIKNFNATLKNINLDIMKMKVSDDKIIINNHIYASNKSVSPIKDFKTSLDKIKSSIFIQDKKYLENSNNNGAEGPASNSIYENKFFVKVRNYSQYKKEEEKVNEFDKLSKTPKKLSNLSNIIRVSCKDESINKSKLIENNKLNISVITKKNTEKKESLVNTPRSSSINSNLVNDNIKHSNAYNINNNNNNNNIPKEFKKRNSSVNVRSTNEESKSIFSNLKHLISNNNPNNLKKFLNKNNLLNIAKKIKNSDSQNMIQSNIGNNIIINNNIINLNINENILSDSKKNSNQLINNNNIYSSNNKSSIIDLNIKNMDLLNNNYKRNSSNNSKIEKESEPNDPKILNKIVEKKNLGPRMSEIRMNEKLGEFIYEEFKIISKIGEGSFGQIYHVEDRQKRSYCMKKIVSSDLKDLNAFEQEYILVNKIRHDNVLRIYSICRRQLDSTTYVLYILMEKAVLDWDKEIKSRAMQKRYYAEKDLLNILKQCVEALSFLQENNISHRDIKPQNILLFKGGIFKMADFGEAKKYKNSKMNRELNTLRGTELYMSPILFEGLNKNCFDLKHNSYKSDVFSLGFCFLYAASLSLNNLFELRKIYDSNYFNSRIKKMLKNMYSDFFIEIIQLMLEIREDKRLDYIELRTWLEKKGI